MWELIAANKRKSYVLMTVMGMLMIGVGMIIGEAIAPGAWFVAGIAACRERAATGWPGTEPTTAGAGSPPGSTLRR